jgi:tetratricopeptide (TPR) repeat protein
MILRLFSKISAVTALLLLFISAAFAAAPNAIAWSSGVDAAINTLANRVQSTPNDAEAYHQLSKIYYHLKMWDRAVDNGERAVALAPNNSDYWMWLARAYGEKADNSNFVSAYSLAKKVHTSFEKAVALNPTNVPAMTDLAEFYIEAPSVVGGGTDKAVAMADRLSSIDKGRSHWVRARLAEKNKDYATAERELKAAIRDSGNNGEYWLNLAYLYGNLQRWNDMDSAISSALSSNTKPVEALYNAASDYYRVGRNLPQAAGYLRKYIATAPDNDEAPLFEAHYLLGQVLEKQGDSVAAATEYRNALNLANNYAPARDALKHVSSANHS